MKSLIKSETKRIFGKNILILVTIIITFTTLYVGVSNYIKYEVKSYENNNYSSRENLKISKKKGKKVILDEKFILSLKNRKLDDILLYKNIDDILIKNLNIAGYSELTETKVKNFYNTRLSIIKDKIMMRGYPNYTEDDINNTLIKANKLDPVPMKYSEGWKNINRTLGVIIPLIMILISIIILPVFGEVDKYNMTEMFLTTKYGDFELRVSKIIAALKISFTIFAIGIISTIIVNGLLFGLEGFNLPIQNNPIYFFSVHNISYFQQFLINISLSIVGIIFLVGFILFFSSITKSFLFTGMITVFFWGVMFLLEQLNNFKIDHNFTNFLPYKITDFYNHYNSNEIYKFLGVRYNSITWTISLSLLLGILFIISSYFIYDRNNFNR